MSFDHHKFHLNFKFKNYASVLAANGTHSLLIILSDKKQATMEYKMNVIFHKAKKLDYETKEEEVQKIERSESGLSARIKSFD